MASGKMAEVVDTDTDDLREQVASLSAQVQTLIAAKTGSGGLSEAALEAMLLKVAKVSAEAQERAANPSNRTHPGISVYSYPEGDRAKPRPPFKCPMVVVGYDLQHDTTTVTEIELLNLAAPGIYPFRRTDGSLDQLTITATSTPSGGFEKLFFAFQTEERRESLPSLEAMLRYAFHQKSADELELEHLRAEVEALRAKATVAA